MTHPRLAACSRAHRIERRITRSTLILAFPRRSSHHRTSVHLRLARAADLPAVMQLCAQHGETTASPRQRPVELPALWTCQWTTILVAWRDRTLLGVMLCGVTDDCARLEALLAIPGREQAHIERRLLRRMQRHLRALGLISIDFDGPVWA